jgi:hypothetical protein
MSYTYPSGHNKLSATEQSWYHESYILYGVGDAVELRMTEKTPTEKKLLFVVKMHPICTM